MPHILLAALALCFASPFIAGAQELGLFSSPKGIGASVHFPEKDGIFHTLHAYVDIYGVATSRCSFPGYKANFSRQYVCGRFQRDGYSIAFYAGPGLSLGYVRDHDKGRGFDLTSLLADNEGMTPASSSISDGMCSSTCRGRPRRGYTFAATRRNGNMMRPA